MLLHKFGSKPKIVACVTLLALMLTAAPIPAQTTVYIKKHFVEEQISDLEKFYRQVQAVPYFKKGLSLGFKVLLVKPGGFFEKIGIERDDILLRVNENLLTLYTGFKPFQALRVAHQGTVTVLRSDKEYKIDIQIVP